MLFSCFGGEFPSLLLGDLFDLSTETSNSEFFIRVFWMHALFSFYNDEVATAINKLSIVSISLITKKFHITKICFYFNRLQLNHCNLLTLNTSSKRPQSHMAKKCLLFIILMLYLVRQPVGTFTVFVPSIIIIIVQ